MNQQLKHAFNKEMESAKQNYRQHQYDQCFHHLERAHILGQRYYFPHVISHWWMLKTGWQQADWREIFGQLIRIPASIGSVLGWVPVGNTGGANVSAIKPMIIPADLETYLQGEPQPSIWRVFFRVAALAAIMGFAYISIP